MLHVAGRFDPAQRAEAWDHWRHLEQRLDVDVLLHTHDEVNAVFKHGPHKGETVVSLTRRLINGYPLDRIPPLVLVRCLGSH